MLTWRAPDISRMESVRIQLSGKRIRAHGRIVAAATATNPAFGAFYEVQTDETGQSVIFVIANGKAERRAVRLGERGPQGQFVTAGVSPGETVAVEGADHLKDGSAVRVVKNTTS